MFRRQWPWHAVVAVGALLAASPALAQELPGEATATAAASDSDAAAGPTLYTASWTATLGIDTAADEPDEDILALRNRLDISLSHPVSANQTVQLAARLQHRAQVGHDGALYKPAFRASLPDLGMRYDTLPELRQANLQWQKPWGRLTVGRDIVSWGALELQSPLRIVCPTDFSMGLAGIVAADESPLLPTWLVRLQRPLGAGQIDLLFLPFFDQHRFSPFATDAAFVRPGFGPDLPAALAGMLRRMDLRLDRSLSESLMNALKPPSATPLDGSVGGRWSVRTHGADLALVALLNWDRMPELHLDPDLVLLLSKSAGAGFDPAKLAALFADPAVAQAAQRAQGKQFTDIATAKWHRRAVVGGELQVELAEGWLLRGEVAYSHRRVFMDRQFTPVLSGLVQAGAGLEVTRGDWPTLLVEATWQWAHDIASDRQLLLAAPMQVQVGGGMVMRMGDGEAWLLQLGGFYGVTLRDWVLVPKVRYDLAERWQVALGAVLADGPVNSLGGFFGHDSQVLVEIRRAL